MNHENQKTDTMTPTVIFDDGKIRYGRTYTLDRGRLSRKVLGIPFDGKPQLVRLSDTKGKEKEKVTVTLFPLSHDSPEGEKMTYFDMEIHNAVGNLTDNECFRDSNGESVITEENIFRVMTGYKGHDTSKTMLETIKKSLQKQFSHSVSFGQHSLKNDKYLKALKEMEGKQPIINGEPVTVKDHGGQEKRAWRIKGEPAFYRFSKMIEQVSAIDAALLQAGNVSNTKTAILLRLFLFRQIERVKQHEKQDDKRPDINLDTIFERIEDPLPLEKTANGRTARKIRIKTITAILTAFKAAGYIRDWEFVFDGRTTRGIRFKVHSVRGAAHMEKQRRKEFQ